ncbi:MAG: hypothetical protein Q7S21_07300 [archaeon]|nr:hypothetical protein [archaeon]
MAEIADTIETKTPIKTTKKRSVDTWKKKKWFAIISPKMFGEKQIEETVAEKPELLINRIVSPTVRELGGNPKKSFYNLDFKVFEVQGLKANTKLVGHQLKGSFLKRFIRRRASKIELTQFVTVKDGAKVKVKTVVLTERKATGIQKTAIRKAIEAIVAADARKHDSEKFIYDIVFGDIEHRINKAIKNIILIKKIEIVQSKAIEGK